jgi:predicted ferric reductase
MLGSVNWLAIIVATLASMALGFAWYMVLANQWMAALGKTREQIMANSGGAMPYILAALMQLIMAYSLALFVPRIMGATTITNGLIVGFHAWLGFVITSMIINHRYQGSKWSLTLIDGGYLLGVLLVQGLVIGLFG